MITAFVISGVLSLLLVVLSFLPVSTSLPFGIDQALYTTGVWIHDVIQYVWPLEIFFKLFFLIYLPFTLLLIVLKFVLGHRAP